MHKCHDIHCLAKTQLAKWETIWDGSAQVLNTIVIDYTKGENI